MRAGGGMGGNGKQVVMDIYEPDLRSVNNVEAWDVSQGRRRIPEDRCNFPKEHLLRMC